MTRSLIFFFTMSLAVGFAQAFQCPDRFKVFDERRGWICADGDASSQGFSTADEIFESPTARSDRNDRGDFDLSENFQNPNYQPVGIIGKDDRRLLNWEEIRQAAVGVVGCNGHWSSGSVVYQGNLVVTAKHVFFDVNTNAFRCAGKKMYFQVENPETKTRRPYRILRLHAPPGAVPFEKSSLFLGPKPGLQGDTLVAELDRPVEEFTPTYLPESLGPFLLQGELHGAHLFGFFYDLEGEPPGSAPGTLFFSGSSNYPSYFKGVPDLFVTDIDAIKGSSGSPFQVTLGGRQIIVGILLFGRLSMDMRPFNTSPDQKLYNFNGGVRITSWLRDTLLSLSDPQMTQYYYRH